MPLPLVPQFLRSYFTVELWATGSKGRELVAAGGARHAGTDKIYY